MRSVNDFVVSPLGSRYNNTKKIGETELILNTTIFNHEFVNREAVVQSVPIVGDTDIKPGDTVIVHHNVFRRWHNVRDEEKNSRSYFNENTYLIAKDQIYLVKNNNKWKSPEGYCFVKPIISQENFDVNKEQSLIGVLKHADNSINKLGLKAGDLVGFTPQSEYEFTIDNEKLYRVHTKDITIKYEYQGNEKEYNPSWA